MPSIDEVKHTVASSEQRDWQFFDAPEIYVYSPDPDIRIERYKDGEMSYDHVWLENYHHSEDTINRIFRVYYRSSPIDHLHVLRIDEGRFQIPTPRVKPGDPSQVSSLDDYDEISVSKYQAGIGKAMTGGNFDHYLNLGNITVRDEVF